VKAFVKLAKPVASMRSGQDDLDAFCARAIALFAGNGVAAGERKPAVRA
jgi:hypothetical protein